MIIIYFQLFREMHMENTVTFEINGVEQPTHLKEKRFEAIQ